MANDQQLEARSLNQMQIRFSLLWGLKESPEETKTMKALQIGIQNRHYFQGL